MRQNAPSLQNIDSLASWLMARGLEGASQKEVLDGYCSHLVDMGVPLMRLHAAQSAFHPNYGGTGYSWSSDQGISLENYVHTDSPQERWLASPLYVILTSESDELRERLVDSNTPSRFPFLNELRDRGATDYFAMGVLMEKHGGGDWVVDPNNAPEGVLLSWASNAPDGFRDQDLDLIRQSIPYLGLALKSAANRRMAEDLLGVYLGRDAGRRVFSGEIRRGSLQQIDAVIWNFDLEGFTTLAERIPGPDMIAMLNDYFGVVVDVVQQKGGNILKFMGDGLMAMFDVGELHEDAHAALEAVVLLRERMAEKNEERRAAGLEVAEYTLALHAGEILYGNIGAASRLDFTVIGPAVNQTARISGMHKALGQKLILSDEVANAARPCKFDLVSLGRYMLRGVPEPKELFTLFG
ncbi:adenylate/guanylate cyclase domain-containing protein [Primorskyibacter sp. S87]|uniref:adenylate/guanylate cyclase domain-containing protein n=1 Tax=Primorskyibacter sp. S87 TaxID=3415126 RepID=UPI003C7D8E1E